MLGVKKVSGTTWKVLSGVGIIAGLLLSVGQLSDFYWKKAENLVKGTVEQSTIQVTAELRKTERKIGAFLIDDIRFRLIAIRDEIAFLVKREQAVPRYLTRQQELLTDQLVEARDKWKNL